MCVLGMSEEYKKYNIAVNALWPRTTINTAALNNLGGVVNPNQCRTPEILSDSAFYLLQKDSKSCTLGMVERLVTIHSQVCETYLLLFKQ